MWEHYVIDADMSNVDDDSYCVCPVELDEHGEIMSVVTGMNYIVGRDGLKDYNIIAVLSLQGNEAAQEFCDKMDEKKGRNASELAQYRP